MEQAIVKNELCVIPLSQTVLFPDSSGEIKVDRVLGSSINQHLKDDENYALALLVKENIRGKQIARSLFHNIGTLIRIKSRHAHGSDYGYQVEVLNRVEVGEFTLIDQMARAGYTILEESVDMDDKNQSKMLEYMKVQMVQDHLLHQLLLHLL